MENLKTPYKNVLTIAGSDSGGCAGIQADIKSISACGAFAASVITATTAQNTLGVFDIHPIPISHIEKQLDAVLSDIDFGAIKIGMLHSDKVIEIVSKKLEEYQCKNIVLDPVMVATSGDKLFLDNVMSSMLSFLPKAKLITPNVYEAEMFINQSINWRNFEDSAKVIGERFKTSVLLKGGHMKNSTSEVSDLLYLYESDETIVIKNPRIETKNTHGTGCSLSSSIAAYLSLDYSLEDSVAKACSYLNKSIDRGKNRILGKGRGPVNHFDLI